MNKSDISTFEQVQSQLQSLHSEIGSFAKKKPDDAINLFKLKLINQVIAKANGILDKGKPFNDFDKFDEEGLPTNSDVVLILSQYLNCLEKLRADNISRTIGDKWYWDINGKQSNIPTAPPKKIK